MPWLILGIAGLAGVILLLRRDGSAPMRESTSPRESPTPAPGVDGVDGSTKFKELTLDHIARNVAAVFEVAKGNVPQAIADVSAGFRQMPATYRQYVGKKAVELGAPTEGIRMALLASQATSSSFS